MADGEITAKGSTNVSSQPATNYGVMRYDSAAKKWKNKDDANAEKTFQFEEDAASTAIIHNWKLNHVVTPLEEIINTINLLNFNDQGAQKVFSEILEIPTAYTSGDPIKLKDLMFFAEDASNNVLFRCKAYLIRPTIDLLDPSSPDAVSSIWKVHTSTNTEITLSGSAHELYSVGVIDLSDGTGKIEAVSISSGDLILVELYRDVANESSPSTGAVRLVHNKQNVSLG